MNQNKRTKKRKTKSQMKQIRILKYKKPKSPRTQLMLNSLARKTISKLNKANFNRSLKT